MKRSFLISVVAAIATLTSAPSFSAQQRIHDASDNSSKDIVKSSDNTLERMIKVAQGNEMHDLILKSSETGQTLAYHYSHSSHASHASHASHYSGR